MNATLAQLLAGGRVLTGTRREPGAQFVAADGTVQPMEAIFPAGTRLVAADGTVRTVIAVDNNGWLKTDAGDVNPQAPHVAELEVHPAVQPEAAVPAARVERFPADTNRRGRGDLRLYYSDEEIAAAVHAGALSMSEAMNQDF